nr:hypothetical protein [uncultured Paracoccus sp.]
MPATRRNAVTPTATAPTTEKMSCHVSDGIVLDDSERGVKPGHPCRNDEGQSNQQTRPDRTDQHEQALTDCQCQTGGEKTNNDAAEPASTSAIGQGARVQTDKERQSKDGEIEQQPAHSADGCDGNEDSENDHGGVSVQKVGRLRLPPPPWRIATYSMNMPVCAMWIDRRELSAR